MITNSDIKAAWISRLKSNPVVTVPVPAVEIREIDWKGTDFTFPCIRVQLGPLKPTVQGSDCSLFTSPVSIIVYSETKSSQQADDIAGIIADQYWGKKFVQGNVRFVDNILIEVVPAAIPEGIDRDVWRSVVSLNSRVQLA